MVGESDSVRTNNSVRSDSFSRGESAPRIHTAQPTPEYLVEVVVAEAAGNTVVAAAVADVDVVSYLSSSGDR